jgi:SARP family transcriptional regulator, regulator of embCAB operon
VRLFVLGQVEVSSPRGSTTVRGRHQRALLIALAANANRVVPVESLVTELWGEDPPQRTLNALQAHVSRLRRLLAEVDDSGHAAERISGAASGYRMYIGKDDGCDGFAFLRDLAEIQALPPGTSPAETTRRIRSALAAWRGPVFGGFVGGPICQATAARYEESRMAALQSLFDNELKLGNHLAVIAELSALVEADPLNERLCEQLMVALYRAGRQTDALSVYHRIRRRLDDELGVDPSPTLRVYERAILGHDPALSARADHGVLRTAGRG